ncbi:TetR/AcrR family transcriptional regulator [Leptolyngbya sp. NK1-12]|uniref:TetR/AcrR family transcriptional regulator n=1 Tax=Leptolyngbya sp. NK1-12 TaxID=2547451 RepID=UPI00292F590F|nr:TetR/AcrR family transcriptional regulator [Leptolyngbya sp. NK1-12]
MKSSINAKSSATRQRDPEATKAQILDAAEEEFARYGLTGARTEAIAANTGVTKAMIHYYFGSKETLYKAVLERHATDFIEAFEQLNLQTLPPEEALKVAIREGIRHEAMHPHQGKVLLHEAMQNQGKYFKLTAWETPINLLISILQQGIDEGCFRPLNPWLMVIHIMGIISFYFNAQANLKTLAPNWDSMSTVAIEEFTESAIALILAGVKKG